MVSGLVVLEVVVVVVVGAVFTETTYAWAATKGSPGNRAEWSQRPSPCMQCGSIQRR